MNLVRKEKDLSTSPKFILLISLAETSMDQPVAI